MRSYHAVVVLPPVNVRVCASWMQRVARTQPCPTASETVRDGLRTGKKDAHASAFHTARKTSSVAAQEPVRERLKGGATPRLSVNTAHSPQATGRSSGT